MRRTMMRASIAAVAAAMTLGVTGMALPAGAATTGAAPTGGAPKATPATSTGATGTAATATPARVDRSWLEHALARRQATLSRLTTAVNGSRTLSATVRGTLQSQLATETAGIDSLAATAPHEPTATLAGTAATMVHQYRVYLVMVPKVRIALRAADQARAEQRATHVEGVISSRIAAAQAAGRTVAKAQAADQDLAHQIARATSDTSASSAILTVEPSGYPAGAGTIRSARADVLSARSVLPAVRADLRTIRSSLEGA